MDTLERFDRVVSAVYDAALQPDLWPAALDGVTAMLSCDVFHAFVWDEKGNRPMATWASIPASEPVHRLYNEYYGRIDPRRALADATDPGRVFVCHQHFDARFVGASDFYQDFLIPCGMRFMVGSPLAREDGRWANVAFLRATGRPEFSAGEIEAAQRIAPHLRRAMEMILRTQQVADALAAGDRAMEGLDMGLAVLDEAGRVLYLNPAAQAMLAPGACLRLAAGRLAAARSASGLERARHRVASSGQPQTVLVHSPTGPNSAGAMFVTFSRLPPSAPLAEALGHRYLALIGSRQRRGLPSVAQLMSVFGLTHAEGHLAHELALGLSLSEIAGARGVRVSTVRTQLLGLLAKTGTQRQQELVGLLARMPTEVLAGAEGGRPGRGGRRPDR